MSSPSLVRAALLFCTCFSLRASTISLAQTNLVSNVPGLAVSTDANLVNPWGLAFSSTSPFWIANNGTGVSTLYRGNGAIVPLTVTIPQPGGGISSPTGALSNATADFKGDRFIFATENGTIAGWSPPDGTSALVQVDQSASGAVYKGLASGDSRLYAADFANNTIDVYDSMYNPITAPGGFVDPGLPSGFAPFNIQNIGGTLYVTYAKKGSGADDEAGPGNGFIDRFDTDGVFLNRLVSNGVLNSPWGLALAPSGFGDVANDLLVGNFGDGRIHAFDPISGDFITSLSDSHGNPIVIDGLWGLAFGNDGIGFDSRKLYFTAGLNDETDGLFGSLTATPEPGSMLLTAAGLAALALLRRKR